MNLCDLTDAFHGCLNIFPLPSSATSTHRELEGRDTHGSWNILFICFQLLKNLYKEDMIIYHALKI